MRNLCATQAASHGPSRACFFQSFARGLTLTLLLSVLAHFSSTAQAQVRTWDGSSSGVWGTTANWSGDNVPNGTGEAAVFDTTGSGTSTLSVNANVTVGQIRFSGNAPSYTIGGASTLTLSPAASFSGIGIVMTNGAQNQTVSAQLALAASQTFLIEGGTLVLGGTITESGGGTKTLTIIGGSDIDFNGDLGGTGAADQIALTISGTGRTTLNAANGYEFGTTVNSGGILRVANSGGLGDTANGTTINSGGTLELFGGGVAVGAETLSLDGTGVGAGGALRNVSGDNSWAGTITLADAGANSSVRINSDSGALTITGGISEAGDFLKTIFIGGSGNVTVGGNITETLGGSLPDLGITKDGTGTLTLSGANTYQGITTVSGGVLLLNSANALPGGIDTATSTTESALTIGGGVVGLGVGDFTRALGAGDGQVQWTSSGGFAAYSGARNVNLGGSGTPSTVTWTSGSFVPNGSALILGSSGADNTVTFQNPINLNAATRTVQVNNGSATLDAVLSGVLGTSSGTASFTKTGAGTLGLTAANTYNGATAVQDGAVQLYGGNDRLPTGTMVTLGGGSTSGKLILGNSAATSAQTLAGLVTSGAGTANAVVGGNASGSMLTLHIISGTITFGGTLGGAGANENNLTLAKAGAGELVLSGANTYNAGTTLSGVGSITLGSATALGTGGLTVSGGATLNANNQNASIGALSLSGNATINLATGTPGDILTFASASGSGGILTIQGWTGSQTGGDDDIIAIAGAADSAFLANVQFGNGTEWIQGAEIFFDGLHNQLVPSTPVPEPINIALGIFAAGFASVGFGRRYFRGNKTN